MPFARLTLIPAQTTDLLQRLTERLTDLIVRDLGKRHELTSVLIEVPNPACWNIGTKPKEFAAHLEVCVTAKTNTEAEKQAFITNAMQLLRAEIPNLPSATYVVVKELAGTDWGYDGTTQADRAV